MSILFVVINMTLLRVQQQLENVFDGDGDFPGMTNCMSTHAIPLGHSSASALHKTWAISTMNLNLMHMLFYVVR